MIHQVWDALRNQRESWKEISERVGSISDRDLPRDRPRRLVLCGLGSSHFAARLAGFAITRDRKRTPFPIRACPSTSIGVEVSPQKGDWFVGISHRGGEGPTRSALELADRLGAFTILVSGQEVETPPYVQLHLKTVPNEQVEPHTISMTGAICAVTSLMMRERAVEEWEALRSLGDPSLERYRNLLGTGPDVILGEWEGEWLAREGALKLMEMAKVRCRTYSTEEYFHGPHLAAKSSDQIWHISMPKDPRNGRFEPTYSIQVYTSSPLGWVPALLELQWSALAVAQNLENFPMES